MAKKIDTCDVWMNLKKSPEPDRKGLEYGAEDDTLMGRLAKRMASRDIIDEIHRKKGIRKDVTMADADIPRKMNL